MPQDVNHPQSKRLVEVSAQATPLEVFLEAALKLPKKNSFLEHLFAVVAAAHKATETGQIVTTFGLEAVRWIFVNPTNFDVDLRSPREHVFGTLIRMTCVWLPPPAEEWKC